MFEFLESIVTFIFVAVGIGAALYSIRSCLITRSAKTWMQVSGKIISHGIDESRDVDGDYTYEATVEYTYEYRGRRLGGSRIAFGFGSWNIKWLVQGVYRDAVARAPAVTVFVNPKNPKQSCFICGIRSFHIANIVFFSLWNFVLYKALIDGSV